MKTAKEIAQEAFGRIQNCGAVGATFLLHYRIQGYAMHRMGTAKAAEVECKRPKTIVGIYDFRASQKQIEDDLIAAGCPA